MSRPLLVMLALAGLAVAGCGATETGGVPRPMERPSSPVPAPTLGSVDEVSVIFSVDPPGDMTVRTLNSADASLRGPHFSLGLNWVATGASIDEHSELVKVAGVTPRRAEEHEEIMVLAVDPKLIGVQWKLGGQPKPVAELVVDGKPRPLSKVPIPNADGLTPVDGPGVLVVTNVPNKVPVRLTVRDMDRVQTLDVRAGKRADDTIPGYYQPTRQTLNFDQDLSTGVAVRSGSYPVTLTIADRDFGAITDPSALLAPWTPSQGWAAPGRAWLILPCPVLSTDVRAAGLILVIDEPAAFRVRLPDGTQVREIGGSHEVYTTLSSQAPDLLFDVPANFATGIYLIDLSTAKVTVQSSQGDLPARWRPAPPTIEVPINLTT